MQGYFSYKFIGSREEMKKVLNTLHEIEKGTHKEYVICASEAKDLLMFGHRLEMLNERWEDTSNGDFKLTLEMPRSSNVNGLSFLFEEIPYQLATCFKDVYIEGTGYLLDFTSSYDEFTSPRGSDRVEFHEELEQIYLYEDDVNLEEGTVIIQCALCELENKIELEKDIAGNYKTSFEVRCSQCDCPMSVEFDFNIESEEEYEINISTLETVGDDEGQLGFTCSGCERYQVVNIGSEEFTSEEDCVLICPECEAIHTILYE